MAPIARNIFSVSRHYRFLSALLVISILLCFFSELTLLASPYRIKPFPQVGFFDAVGANYFCGAQDVTLDAIGPLTILPGHTYTYQWQYYAEFPSNFWVNYTSGTSRSYTVSFATAPASKKVRCNVTEYVSGVYNSQWTTGTATLYVSDSPPGLTTSPGNATTCDGGSASFSCSFSGNYLQYQWYEVTPGGVSTAITGAVSTSYTLNPTPVSKTLYRYKCIAANACNEASTSEAVITVNLPPSIIAGQPSATAVCEGLPLTFTVNTNNPSNVTSYQWQCKPPSGNWTACSGAPYSGINTKDLYISNSYASMNSYQYQCYITGLCGFTGYSAAATLTVKANPTITSQPSDQTKCFGESVTYGIITTGYYVRYSWEKKIPGDIFRPMTSDTLSSYTHIASAGENGNLYHCKAFNSCSFVYSSEVSLTVHTPPAVTLNTSDITICAGETTPIGLSVSPSNQVTGLVYQQSTNSGSSWETLASTPATTTMYALPIPQASMNGYLYRVSASGYCSPVAYTNTISLTVRTAPSISQQMPVSQTLCTGTAGTMSISVGGSTPLEYKWRKNSVSLSGSDWTTNPYYQIPNVQTADAGTYDVIVKNSCNTNGIISDASVLTVNTAPSISRHPDDVSLCEGSQTSVSFSASISGGSSLQWEFSDNTGSEWANLPENSVFKNVTSNTLTVNSTNRQYNNYRFRCKVLGLCEPAVTTNPALLTIKTPPEVLTQPVAKTVCVGDSVSLRITASGTEPLEYKWKKGGTGVTNWSNSALFFLDESSLDNYGSYTCLIRNECAFVNNITSDAAVLTINPAPTVSLGNDIHICPGNSVNLTPGNGYASYLWSTAETTSSITVSSGGNYEVTVSDGNNCKNTDMIFVIADSPIPAINLGNDATYCKGEDVLLNAGSGYDFYNWSNLSTVQSITVTSSGNYSVTAGRNNSVCRVNDAINITFANPYEDEKICMVMTDPETEKNLIIWEKTPNVGTEKYQVWKIAGADYSLVNETMEAESSYIVDWNSKPRSKTDAYVLVSVDTCGNVSQKSPWHKPFFLQSGIGLNNVINLTWEPYLVNGDEYIFKSLVIYRGTDSTKLEPIDTIAGGIGSVSYTDENPPYNVRVFYRIGGEKDVPCDPDHALGKKVSPGPYVHSLSNLEDNRLQIIGIEANYVNDRISIYPNPLKTQTKIAWPNPGGEKYELFIYDLKGTLIRIVQDLNSSEYTIKREGMNVGCYLIELRGSHPYYGKLMVIE